MKTNLHEGHGHMAKHVSQIDLLNILTNYKQS